MKWQEIGAGIAQLIERPTEKQGTTLTRIRAPGPAAKNLSVRNRTVSAQPPCAIGFVNISAQVKNPKPKPYTIVWSHKNSTDGDRNGWHCSCGCCTLPR